MWSPPNFCRYAPASTIASIASPTTPAAGTTTESVRSRSAWAGSRVAMSTERSGFVSVGSGLIPARITHRSPVVKAPVEALLPAHVRSEARDDAEGDDLEHAPDRLVRLAQRFDVLDHRAARL